ncbi:beta-1,4-galactosyltransferase 3-like [Hemiscyllium ocellatum]|uniref:beta-1,4-galactosyltransferase 3-like n=1 Tax=Hemiscyllium ocellatum TaxID=170820 RepID=UPI002966F160|nr:beta-1,4-galactosyltransferase 3-like [Hemiscyllium ocellatum]
MKIPTRVRFLAVLGSAQLLVILLVYREGSRQRVSAIVSALWKTGSVPTTSQANSSQPGDIYANLSLTTPIVVDEDQLPSCPSVSPYLSGPIRVTFPKDLSLEEVRKRNPMVLAGGWYKPPDCESKHSTAVLVPHRHREQHLKYLLYYLHPMLQKQQLQYRIYIIHQAGNTTFNRAKLYNVGFKEAMKDTDWECLYFHDVDLIPEDDRNLYTCEKNPKHASESLDTFGYKVVFPNCFGGVSAFTPDQFMKVNGFPNNYWGWGGEDDDLINRVWLSGMSVFRTALHLARYKMVKHSRDKGNEENPKRWNLLTKTSSTWKQTGLNNLDYVLLSKEYLPLYTNITVDVGTEKGGPQRAP